MVDMTVGMYGGVCGGSGDDSRYTNQKSQHKGV